MRAYFVAVLAGLSLAGCSGGEAGEQKGGSGRGALRFPVEVKPVESRTVEYRLNAVGSVEAFEKVLATARVAGVVEKVRFAEGNTVAEGAVLAEIEPERFRLAVVAAEAAFQRAEAEKKEAESGLERRQKAMQENPGLIRGEEMETWETRASTAAANVSAAKAALDQARLNLRDAYVRAPTGGTIESRTVQTGQYVQPGAVLATLVRRDPLLLRFSVTEPEASQLRPGMEARFEVRGVAKTLTAKVTHVAAAADAATRMVPVTAEVAKEDRDAARPGAFAEVEVGVQAIADALVVPETSIRPSEKGFLAYVVDGGVARERILTLGMRTADGLVEVRDGLKADEILVVRGAEALREGAEVRVVEGAGSATDTPAVKEPVQ